MSDSRFGFVALLGIPNAGKSTFLNRIVGDKVSIVTPKVQTTRRRIVGVVVRESVQLAFVDTPGIFTGASRRLEKAMVDAAWKGGDDADVVCVLVDVARCKKGVPDDDTRMILEKIRNLSRPTAVLLNKTDALTDKNALLPIMKNLSDMGFRDVFPVSAKNGDGMDEVLKFLCAVVPAGSWLFAEDQLSDLSDRMLAAEITREKLFLALRQEVPYELTVETEKWEEFDNGDVKIHQIIYLSREGQKPIVVGKGGQQIKQIREAAQKELKSLFGRKVHLFLYVKVREDWMERAEHYREMGLE
jgi:GTP-binding protein Era